MRRWWREKQEKKAAEQRAETKARIDKLVPLRDPDATWKDPMADISESIRSFTINMPNFDEQLLDMEKTARGMTWTAENVSNRLRVFTERGQRVFTDAYWGKKKITDIVVEQHINQVDVTTFSDPVPRTVPGSVEVTITDQDGEKVPDELRQKALDIIGSRTGEGTKELDHRLKELLADWNSDGPEPMSEAPPGHKQGCVYRGSHHFACTCQPPTLWDKVKLWYCDCCEEPVALIQYGVCENCEGHEYSSPMQVEADHKAAKTYA